MARPQRVSDLTILTEAYDLIMNHGLEHLTFENLGKRAGLVPAALVRRFKNKTELIARIDQYALERTNARLATTLDSTESCIDTIIDYFTAELEFASTIDKFANGQEFLLMDLRHETLYKNYQQSFQLRHSNIVQLLERAMQSLELQNITDAETLARHLEMIAHGSGHVWAMNQDATIAKYISLHIQQALLPYKAQSLV